VQFPLDRTLTVRKGYLVALTVPSWAPALALGQDSGTLWRASRATNACDEPGSSPRSSASGTGPVPLPVPDGAPDLQRDDDHDADSRRSRRAERAAQALEQRRDDLRVELRAGLARSSATRVLARHRLAVRAASVIIAL
jgi:hypothetical protein